MEPVRIAMWSGPRTISTAMMRSFENRPDCVVVDEPLYAYFLAATGTDHPGRAEVLTSQPTDWRAVVEDLTTGDVGAPMQYQKHMTHHLLPDVDADRLARLRHAFLIREPAQVLKSYARVRSEPTLDDLGLPQQVALFEQFGGPVIDSADVLRNPERALTALCEALGLAFDPAMLVWPAGRRDTDGVWGEHWYSSVWASTGFGPYVPPDGSVPDHLGPLLEKCRPFYEQMARHRIRFEEA